jgi:hypothetical protein
MVTLDGEALFEDGVRLVLPEQPARTREQANTAIARGARIEDLRWAK